jgi:hypothetical protein
MPRGRHAAQDLHQHDQQRQPRGDWVPAEPRRPRITAGYGGVVLAAALSLVLAMVAMRAVADHGTGDAAALSALRCASAPKLVADTSVVSTPLGVNASGPSQLTSATAEFGHMPVIRIYYAAVPSPQEWTTGVAGMNHSAVVLSFNPGPSAILSGANDAALAHFFDAAPTGHPVYYSYWAEPESSIKKGQFSLAQFKAAFTHIVAIANAAHNPDLHATLILQGQDARPGDEYNFRDYLPAGGVISAIGWDAYPDGTVENQDPQPTPPGQFMGQDIAASRSVGLPYGFAEFALGTQNDRPQWLTEVANYLQNSGALFGTLFNASGFPWMMLHDSASIQSWRSAVSRSAIGSTVPLTVPSTPTPTPTPTPTRSTPTPVPTHSALPGPPQAGSKLALRGLTITPPMLAVAGANHVRIRFSLSQAADVAICVLNSQGRLVRELDRSGLPAGWAAARYYGYGQHHRPLPAGCYQAMVVASNATGSASAQTGLAVIGPGAIGLGSALRAVAHCWRQPGPVRGTR